MSNSFTDFSNDLAVAVEKGSESTVVVDARKRYPASGIAFAEDLVLTADHVVKRDDDIKIGLADGKSLSAILAGRDPGSDLAVLRLSEKILKPAKTSYIKSETTPYPGFSGGPLINTEGEVLGLNTSGLTHGSSLTIPVKVAWRIADALAKHGSVKRGYLGVRTQPVSNGLLVLWLEEGGPAENGGLLVGDILVAVSGQSVRDPDDLFSALNNDTVGKSTAVEVMRGGKPETVNVTIGERK